MANANNGGRISSCYNIGTISGGDHLGAIIGAKGVETPTLTIEKCFYTTPSNACGQSIGTQIEANYISPATNLKNYATQLGAAYTIDNDLNNGYPVLKWETNEWKSYIQKCENSIT